MARTPQGIPDIAPANLPAWAQPLTEYGDVVEVIGKPGSYALIPKTDKMIAKLNAAGFNFVDLLAGGTFIDQRGSQLNLPNIHPSSIGKHDGHHREYRGYPTNLDFWRKESQRAKLAVLLANDGINLDYFKKADDSKVAASLLGAGVRFSASSTGWFLTLDIIDSKVTRDPLQKLVSLKGYLLCYGYFDLWEDFDPGNRGYDGGVVLEATQRVG